jgi:hypothetical protein
LIRNHWPSRATTLIPLGERSKAERKISSETRADSTGKPAGTTMRLACMSVTFRARTAERRHPIAPVGRGYTFLIGTPPPHLEQLANPQPTLSATDRVSAPSQPAGELGQAG